MTYTYLRIILLFAPAFIFNEVFLAFVRNDGAPHLAMYAMVGGSLANILFDYIFIFPLHMGIFGAVLATGCSPLFGMLIQSIYRIRRKNQFHLVRTGLSASLTGSTLALGFSSLVTEVSSGVVMIVFNMLMLRLEGNTAVAAYGVIANLILVVIAIFTGIGQGIQPLISRAYGRGERQHALQYRRYGLFLMAALSVTIYAGILFGADGITTAFNSEQNPLLQQIAVKGLRIYFAGILFAGFNIVLSFYFTSIEKAVPAQVISLAAHHRSVIYITCKYSRYDRCLDVISDLRTACIFPRSLLPSEAEAGRQTQPERLILHSARHIQVLSLCVRSETDPLFQKQT